MIYEALLALFAILFLSFQYKKAQLLFMEMHLFFDIFIMLLII